MAPLTKGYEVNQRPLLLPLPPSTNPLSNYNSQVARMVRLFQAASEHSAKAQGWLPRRR